MVSSIMVDLDDPRTGKIADVISNKTAKRILSLLSEREMSESELARELKVKLNTIGYNIKKLKEAGLIEEVKGFLWSVKGKRVFRYKTSNKRIIISPRRIIRGVIPAVLISGVIAFGIKIWSDFRIMKGVEFERFGEVSEKYIASEAASDIASGSLGVEKIQDVIGQDIITIAQSAWLWFFAGALFGLFVYLVWNYFFRRK